MRAAPLENRIQQLARVSLVVDDDHRCTVQTQLDVGLPPPWLRFAWRHARLIRGTGRQPDRDRRASIAALAVRPDFALVLLDQVAGDRETEPEASVSARRSAVGLSKPVEDVGEKVCLDADACVSNLDLNRFVLGRTANLHAAAFRSEFRRIGHDVAEDLMEPFRISLDRREILGHRPHERNVLGVGAWQRSADDRVNQLGYRHEPCLDFELA